MKFENVLDDVGSFGLYQRLLCFILIPLTTGLCALVYYSQLFILNAPNFFCKQNISVFSNDGENKSILSDSVLYENEVFSCQQLTTNDTNLMNNEVWLNNTGVSTQSCTNGWKYDYETSFPTVTSQNNWVCDEAWKPYITVSLFWVGNTIGAWIFGILSDRFGRRPVIAGALLVYGTAGTASIFVAHHFYAFLALRFMVGFAHHTVTHLPFILVVEYCGIKSRVVPLFTIMATYTLGSILAPILAILIWNWKILILVTSVPNIVLLLLYRWLPESVSWLSTRNKIGPTILQLRKVAKVNRKNISKDFLRQKIIAINSTASHLEDPEIGTFNNTSLLTILKYPKLRRNVAVVLLVWMIGCLCYYGHCQNTSNIGSSHFKSYILGASIEIPSWSVPYLIHKFGRKSSLMATFILSGISGGFYAFLPRNLENTIFAFALLGRLFITGAYYITLQYGPEIFPTVIRGRGVAMSETLGGIAIFVSPLVVYLGEFQLTLPIIIFSSLSIFGGLITTILPETRGKSLPQTLAHAEKFAEEYGSLTSCCKGEHTRVKTTEEEAELSY